MPKRSGLMTDVEREIALRLRQIRYSNQLSVREFANRLGITHARCASFEYGHTPLTVEVADKISEAFDVDLLWLASGRGGIKPRVGLISTLMPEIKPTALLSSVDAEKFSKARSEAYFDGWFMFFSVLMSDAVLPKGSDAERIKLKVQHQIDSLWHDLPHRGKEKLLVLLVRVLTRFETDWELGKRETPGARDYGPQKEQLTSTSEFRNTAREMKSSMKHLMDRVRALTKPAGMKARLAADLKVAQPRITEWLSGKHEPSGEATLRLLEWVQAEAAKQTESPGSGINTAKAKTPLKGNREKTKQSNPKKP